MGRSRVIAYGRGGECGLVKEKGYNSQSKLILKRLALIYYNGDIWIYHGHLGGKGEKEGAKKRSICFVSVLICLNH